MKYKINNIEYDSNSIENQRIKEKFVNREVIRSQSGLVDALLNTETGEKLGFSYENIKNFSRIVCRECGSSNYSDDKCNDCGKEFCDDVEDAEIFEWWIVTDFLERKLKELGECFLNTDYENYWGRQTTGQSIMIDSEIDNICHEMGILQGQEYDWSK